MLCGKVNWGITMSQAMKAPSCEHQSFNHAAFDFPFFLAAMSRFIASFEFQPPSVTAWFGPIDFIPTNRFANSGKSDLSVSSLATLLAKPGVNSAGGDGGGSTLR